MELTELRNGLLDIFGVGDAIALGDAIMSSITTQDYAKFDACVELVGNDGLRHDFLGFDEVAELQDKSRRCAEDMREIIQKITGRELVEPDYILLTKQKNELAFQNRHPEIVSEIFLSILQMYKAHLMFLNNEENRYLAELRDALLPKLMNGEIDLA